MSALASPALDHPFVAGGTSLPPPREPSLLEKRPRALPSQVTSPSLHKLRTLQTQRETTGYEPFTALSDIGYEPLSVLSGTGHEPFAPLSG
jgi:hypothetical protein